MADTKISAGADPVTLVGTDKVPVARSASTTAYAATMTEVAAFAGTGRAPLASPVFTGDPQAPQPPVGDSDASIATTQFVTAAVATALHDVGRNLIHNSMFNIAQRGAGPFATLGTYTLDRWLLFGATDAASILQVALGDGGRAAIGDEEARLGLQNTFTGNAAAGAFHRIDQRIENVSRLAGKTVTISFYASTSSGTPKLGLNMTQSFGTGGSPSAAVQALATGNSVTLSTTWTRYSSTIALPSVAGKTLGTNNDSYTALSIYFSSGATANAGAGNIGVQSGTVNIWGVQLELGPTATPLEKLDPVTQLQQCQRFFQTGFAGMSSYSTPGVSIQHILLFPVRMRAVPGTFTTSGVSQSNCTGASIGAWGDASSYAVSATVTATAAANFNFGWTASADL